MDYNYALKECLGKYVKYNTQIGRQLTDYYEIKHGINSIKGMLEYYDRKYREFHQYLEMNADPNKDLGDILTPLESVLVNIVTTYTRCFDTSKNKEGKESRRVVKLTKHFLRNINPKLVEFHDRFFEIRNKRIAHAGITPLENYEFLIGLTKEGQFHIKPGDDNFRALLVEEVDVVKASLLLDEITKELDKKIEILLNKGYEESELLNRNRVLLVSRLLQGVAITDKDMKS